MSSLLVLNPASAASQEATPSSCPATTEEENATMVRVWHEEAINQRHPEVLWEILDPNVVHHAAGGFPDVTSAQGVVDMMSAFIAAHPALWFEDIGQVGE